MLITCHYNRSLEGVISAIYVVGVGPWDGVLYPSQPLRGQEDTKSVEFEEQLLS